MEKDIRVLGPSAMEDYYAHLLRMARAGRRLAIDEDIDAHCLDLVETGAILVGAYADGAMRAAAEIVPDRTARRAKVVVTVEEGFDGGFERALSERIIKEARRHRFSELYVFERNTSRNIAIEAGKRYAANG